MFNIYFFESQHIHYMYMKLDSRMDYLHLPQKDDFPHPWWVGCPDFQASEVEFSWALCWSRWESTRFPPEMLGGNTRCENGIDICIYIYTYMCFFKIILYYLILYCSVLYHLIYDIVLWKIVLFDHLVSFFEIFVCIFCNTGIVKMLSLHLSLHLSGWHAQRSCPGQEMSGRYGTWDADVCVFTKHGTHVIWWSKHNLWLGHRGQFRISARGPWMGSWKTLN